MHVVEPRDSVPALRESAPALAVSRSAVAVPLSEVAVSRSAGRESVSGDRVSRSEEAVSHSELRASRPALAGSSLTHRVLVAAQKEGNSGEGSGRFKKKRAFPITHENGDSRHDSAPGSREDGATHGISLADPRACQTRWRLDRS